MLCLVNGEFDVSDIQLDSMLENHVLYFLVYNKRQ